MHKNREIQERMDELGFRYAYTPRYSPRYNGIEEVWSISKAYIKKERLNAIVKGKPIYLIGTIFESLNRINVMSIAGCINRSL